MFAVVASSMTGSPVALPSGEQAHADPRVHFTVQRPTLSPEAEVKATLREAAEFAAKRDQKLNEAWHAEHGDPFEEEAEVED